MKEGNLEKRVETLETQVLAFLDCKCCYSKRFHKLDEDTKERLRTLEVSLKMLLDSLGKYMDELNQLKARLSLLVTLHRNELGLLGVDVEKWLEIEKKFKGV